jgi:hypothetical protein
MSSFWSFLYFALHSPRLKSGSQIELKPKDKIDQIVIAVQREIRSHSWDHFPIEIEPGGQKVTVPGCSLCQVQFLDHLADAIPVLFARLRRKKET